jgi:hypothetical protein
MGEKNHRKAIRSMAQRTGELNTLTHELGNECLKVVTLLNQLQLPNLSASQPATILAELLASRIHLHAHCGDDFQNLIAEALEALPDDNEPD